MAGAGPFLSVVIPAYNEEDRLPATIPQVMSFLSRQGYTYEVIVVDDGSTDRTAELLQRLKAQHPNLTLLRLPHRGKASAVRAGVLATSGDRVLFTDADLSAPIGQLPRLMAGLNDGYDIAIGSRESPGARRYREPVYRHLMGRVFNMAVRLIARTPYQDTQCGFKLFSGPAARDIFGKLRLYPAGAPVVRGPMVTGLDVEVLHIAARAGYRVCEVPVEWHYSPGRNVRPALDTYRMLKDVLKVRLNDVRGLYR